MLTLRQVEELVIDYTHCARDAPYIDPTRSSNDQVAQLIDNPGTYSHFKTTPDAGMAPVWSRSTTNVSYHQGIPVAADTPGAVTLTNQTVCTIQFGIPDDIGPPVFFYYRLTNFYQNHRRYVKSLDPDQLDGKKREPSDLTSSCAPLATPSPGTPSDQGANKQYWPCGLIANSQFNDTFTSPENVGDAGTKAYTMTNNGIAWSSDAMLYGDAQEYADNDYVDIVVPPNWQPRWGGSNYSKANPPPDLKHYEEFQVWMRTAGLPAFTKLALRNDDDTMQSGQYRVNITMSKSIPA